eukprot:1367903-Pyramimonas_sp.AAC.1
MLRKGFRRGEAGGREFKAMAAARRGNGSQTGASDAEVQRPALRCAGIASALLFASRENDSSHLPVALGA